MNTQQMTDGEFGLFDSTPDSMHIAHSTFGMFMLLIFTTTAHVRHIIAMFLARSPRIDMEALHDKC